MVPGSPWRVMGVVPVFGYPKIQAQSLAHSLLVCVVADPHIVAGRRMIAADWAVADSRIIAADCGLSILHKFK